MPRISIIIPVYNVEEYLALTLESVFQQTFQDFEAICVNDGSVDNSLQLLRQAQKKDPRIKIVDKKNGGLSSARNEGIEVAQGEYLCFLDSDDLLESNACSRIVDVFENTFADVVTFGATPYPRFRGYDWLNEVLSPRDVVYDSFETKLLFEENASPFVWRTACKTGFLKNNKILFDEDVPFGEDQVFHFAIYPRSAKTVLISDKLLKYRVSREGSLMFSRKKSAEEKIQDHISIATAIFADWQSSGLLKKYADEMLLWSADFIMPELVHQKTEARKDLYPKVKSLWLNYFSSEEIERAQQSSLAAPFIAIVMSDSFGRHAGKSACSAYYRAKDGTLSVIKHAISSKFFGFLHPFRVIARELLPKSSPKKQRAIEERTWDDNDEAQRKRATQNLLAL